MKDKKLILTAGIVGISVILAVVGYIILPNTLVMQVTLGGAPSNTMPKLLGLLIPFGLSSIFAVAYYKTNNIKNITVSLVGLLAFILVFVFNL